MPISPDHLGRANRAFRMEMLVTMKQPARLSAGHISIESIKTDVPIVLAIVN